MAKSFKTAKTIKLFLDECKEYLNSLDQDLVELEGGSAAPELLTRIKRNVHTIKGSSAMLEFNDISGVAHAIENVIAKLEGRLPDINRVLMEEIFNKIDSIKELVRKIEIAAEDTEKPPPPEKKAPVPQPQEKPEVKTAPAAEIKKKKAGAHGHAPLRPEPATPKARRTDLITITGDKLYSSLVSCFRIARDVESKFILADGRELSGDMIDSLDESIQYLYTSLIPTGIAAITLIFYQLRMVFDAAKEGKIERSGDLIDIAFSGISHAMMIVENRLAAKAAEGMSDLSEWHKRVSRQYDKLRGDKDFLNEETAAEIFQRLVLSADISDVMDSIEKFAVAKSLVEGLRIYHVSFIISAEDTELLMNLPEMCKVFFEMGKIVAAIYQHLPGAAGKPEYTAGLFLASSAPEDEIHRLAACLGGVKNLGIHLVNLGGVQEALAQSTAEETAEEAEEAEEVTPASGELRPQAAPRRISQRVEGITTTVRVDTQKLDDLVNLIAELVINRNKIEQEIRSLKQGVNSLSEVYENLKDTRKKASLNSYREVTIEDLMRPFIRLVSESYYDDSTQKERVSGIKPLVGSRHALPLRTSLREEIVRLYEQAVGNEQTIDEFTRELTKVKSEFERLLMEFQADEVNIGRVVDDLQEETMKLRMLPISRVFNKFPRRVRDIAKEIGKKVEFVMEGEDTELDKTLIEKIEDPLMHLIRNAIDHGLETTGERVRVGKPETGRIILKAAQEGNWVVVEVEDDGKGMDAERIVEKALERRLISVEEAGQMDNRQSLNLIFIPGFSTKEEVSDLSGRGVGMDVVKENIQQLKGTVEVHSAVGEGTVFRLKLPLTLAIIPSMIVRTGGIKFVIPMDPIESAELLTRENVFSVEGKEVFRYQDVVLPLVRLKDVFQLESALGEKDIFPVVVVGTADKRIGIAVDEVIEKQQVVIKGMGEFLGSVRHLGGATVFGDGSIALIVDVGGIISSVAQIAQRTGVRAAASRASKRILLVDDSLSGRIAQRDMLERMGFNVEVASSAFQALEMLEKSDYDAVVTDINMPRMDGYEFTATMRSYERTRQMPVILVTSDIKRVDRDKGFDVGVNEFLAKPFTDEDLMVAIEKHLKRY
ncbi:MAG: response regulator [bacterium]